MLVEARVLNGETMKTLDREMRRTRKFVQKFHTIEILHVPRVHCGG